MNISPNNAGTTQLVSILVVENHDDTRKYLCLYLEQLGYRVRTATTMQEGLDELASEPGDVLLSDIGLPDGDGWELMNRAHLPSTVYSLAMSGFGRSIDRSRSQSAGFRHHMVKPFSFDELDKYLEEARRERAG